MPDHTASKHYQFGQAVVVVYDKDQYCETIFPDGLKAAATPEAGPEYLDAAIKHGYSGRNAKWDFCREHELLHHYLACAIGYSYSPTLHDVSHDFKINGRKDWPGGNEEWTVMEFQKLLNNVPFDHNAFWHPIYKRRLDINQLRIVFIHQYRSIEAEMEWCSRCGPEMPHKDKRMTVYPFLHPIEFSNGLRQSESYTHWGICPTTGDPILIRIVDGEKINE